jgi:hypothetical protein
MRYDANPHHRFPTMDFAFILDPLSELKAYKDSSVAMMRELARRGHRIFAVEQGDLFWDAGVTRARARPLELFEDDHAWYREGPADIMRLTDFAAVMMRRTRRSTWSTLFDVPPRMRRTRGRAHLQSPARGPRSQREDGDREIPGLHRSTLVTAIAG